MSRRMEKSKNRSYITILQVLYDLFYCGLLTLSAPYLVYKLVRSRKHRAGLFQRLGNLPKWPDRGPRIWIHGVSVGEVLAAKSLVEVIERELPDHEIVISTTTKTGQEVARQHYEGKRVFYYPLDFSFSTRRVLESVKPRAVILMELEIWPNFLLSTSITEVPVLLVNGRISEKSFRRYGFLQRVIPEPMDRIGLYCVQTRKYADRFRRLGVAPDRVHVTGTMKFDNIDTSRGEGLGAGIRKELGIRDCERVLIGGSTHPTEEGALQEIFEELVREFPEYRLVLVPRHPERHEEVESMLRQRGMEVVRKTTIDRAGPPDGSPVIMVDTMGELARLYAAADLVFVGGSLIPHGGQNMMDPAGLGRPVVFGPHIQNFQEPVDILLEEDAAVMVRDAAGLKETILRLARNPDEAREMGGRARRVVIEQKGASERIMRIIQPHFSEPRGGTDPERLEARR